MVRGRSKAKDESNDIDWSVIIPFYGILFLFSINGNRKHITFYKMHIM
jgi:hypothetical protein